MVKPKSESYHNTWGPILINPYKSKKLNSKLTFTLNP